MDFQEYADFTKTVAKYPATVDIIYPAIGIMGEAAEVGEKVMKIVTNLLKAKDTQDINVSEAHSHSRFLSVTQTAISHGLVLEQMKKKIRTGEFPVPRLGELSVQEKKDIASEVGDVLFYLTRLAEALGMTIEQVAEQNINKLKDRKSRGVLMGEGDNR